MNLESQMELDRDQKKLEIWLKPFVEGCDYGFKNILDIDIQDVTNLLLHLQKIIWQRGGQVRYI